MHVSPAPSFRLHMCIISCHLLLSYRPLLCMRPVLPAAQLLSLVCMRPVPPAAQFVVSSCACVPCHLLPSCRPLECMPCPASTRSVSLWSVAVCLPCASQHEVCVALGARCVHAMCLPALGLWHCGWSLCACYVPASPGPCRSGRSLCTCFDSATHRMFQNIETHYVLHVLKFVTTHDYG